MLSALGKGALMAKVDLKSAFRMVPASTFATSSLQLRHLLPHY